MGYRPDSMSKDPKHKGELAKPIGMGYGFRYDYGIFRKSIRDGWRAVQPDRELDGLFCIKTFSEIFSKEG